MKEVKYIPLDLVKADKNPNIIWKVKDVSQDKRGNVLYRVVAAEDNDAFIYLYEHQIAPVPLTPKILKKNGWERNGGDSYLKYSLYRVFFDVCHVYTLKHYEGSTSKYFDFISKDSKCCYKSNIMYCHQLQHLLFGLGLPMDLKV
jgi:hypothetical protein